MWFLNTSRTKQLYKTQKSLNRKQTPDNWTNYVGIFWLFTKWNESFRNKFIKNNHKLCNWFPASKFIPLCFTTFQKPCWRCVNALNGQTQQTIPLNLKTSLAFLDFDRRTAAENAVKLGKLQQHVYWNIIGVKNIVEMQRGVTYFVQQHFSKLNLTQFFVKTAN